MILTGNQIKKEVESNKISIVPFNENNLSTNSYDLTLGNHFIKYKEKTIDPKRENSYEALVVNDGKFLKLDAGDFYLASSREVVGSNYFVPLIHAKSGIARLGLFVHVTADLIDIGSRGNITFQLYATLPCKIYVGQKIAQVTFWKPYGDIKLYNGKYQGSSGPKASQIYKDFQ